jgi:hypothetical protein
VITDIRVYESDGLWAKPPGAVDVEVIARGGDGGSTDTYWGHEVTSTPGAKGVVTAVSLTAAELPDELHVTVGKGGRPDGRDGYVVIITHCEET